MSAHGADYDESTIITAYSDSPEDDSGHISDSGLLTLDMDSSSKEDIVEEKIEKIETAPPQKRAPVIMHYTVVA